MKLRIKDKEEDIKTIELKRRDFSNKIVLEIDGEHVCYFNDDGTFEFYGVGSKDQFVGRWDGKNE